MPLFQHALCNAVLNSSKKGPAESSYELLAFMIHPLKASQNSTGVVIQFASCKVLQCSLGPPGIAAKRVQAPEAPHQSPVRVVEETAHQEETKDDADVGSTEGRTLADRGERTDGVQNFVRASTLASNRAVRDSPICVFPQTVYLLSGCWYP